MKIYRVGTFFDNDSGQSKSALRHYRAYLRDYNPQWPGCIEYEVETSTGAEAKRLAILMRQEHELAGDPFEEAGL